MNIPEKVKVAGYEYTVERPPEPFTSGPIGPAKKLCKFINRDKNVESAQEYHF